MNKTTLALLSSAFFLSCGRNHDAEQSRADFFAENPQYEKLRALAPEKAVSDLKKPAAIKASEAAAVDPGKGAGELFRLTQNGRLAVSRDFQAHVEEAGDSLLRLSEGWILSFALPAGQRVAVEKGDAIRVRYRVRFHGLEMRSLELYGKEKLVLSLVHAGGDRPVSQDLGPLRIVQSQEEKPKLETPSETYYDVAAQAVVKGGRTHRLFQDKPEAVPTEWGQYTVTLLGSEHTRPKETGSSFEAPLYQLRFSVTARR